MRAGSTLLTLLRILFPTSLVSARSPITSFNTITALGPAIARQLLIHYRKIHYLDCAGRRRVRYRDEILGNTISVAKRNKRGSAVHVEGN